MTAAENWRTTLREALLAARKDRDPIRIAALRTALSAIDNAETPDDATVDAPESTAVAGGVAGLGAAEVARRELDDRQIRDLLRGEVAERREAAEQFSAGGQAERASRLHAEATVLTDLLGDV